MKLFRSLAPLALAAALLAACGGGDPYVPGSSLPTGGPTTPGSFTNIISFGDSLSDIGTYAPATAIPGAPAGSYFGGRFTTNLNNLSTLANTGKVWVEELAASLSTATAPIVVTPAAMGFAGVSQACPAATVNAALAGTCTGYSQGGARVTDPNGIGHSSGFLTVPVKTQIANHLANPTFGGRFKDSDLIIVFAGHNDILYQLTVFGAAVAQSQAQAQAIGSRSMASGVFDQREGGRRLITVPSVGCSWRSKKPTAFRCSSSSSDFSECSGPAGTSAFSSSSSHCAVVRVRKVVSRKA